ncbi:uncharacterized protein LOC116851864 [Odontomachus brunneus]|uniref:uncharacterized protein LOC116851864 n=1 Tax=Odontomachus brunneus TaxID=486640 RepID=UPI0013F1D6A3|nr:uncharacterized protein LOC116851864 [Odontomachus brunneus]
MQIVIALIQEPCFLNNAIKGLSGCGIIYKASTSGKIRACIAVKGITITFMPQLSCKDLVVIQTKINIGEQKTLEVLIGSAYMLYDSMEPPPQDEIRRLVAYAEEKGLELLLGCDANFHHVGWESTNINQKRESLHIFVMGTGLIILNRGTTPTFRDSRREEVIDITIGTEEVSRLVGDWRVLKEPTGSDHNRIQFTLQHISEEKWVRNPRRTDWIGYRKDVMAMLTKAPTRFHTYE